MKKKEEKECIYIQTFFSSRKVDHISCELMLIGFWIKFYLNICKYKVIAF